jgi:hypothetical protein
LIINSARFEEPAGEADFRVSRSPLLMMLRARAAGVPPDRLPPSFLTHKKNRFRPRSHYRDPINGDWVATDSDDSSTAAQPN